MEVAVMSTMIGYTAQAETDSSSKIVHSLLLLVRNFLSQAEEGIQPRHAWEAQQLPSVPPRVWRRHSALLTMLVHQAEVSEPKHNDGK
jgi:hypothetical protein